MTDAPCTLPADVQEAIESARAHVAARYAPFGLEPEVYHVEVCNRHVVLLPLTLQQKETWLGEVGQMPEGKRAITAPSSLLKHVLWWVSGMPEPTPGLPQQVTALRYLRELASVGGSLAFIMDKIAGEYLKQTDEAGGSAQGKKL